MSQRLKFLLFLRYGNALTAIDRREGNILVYGSNGPIGSHHAGNTLKPAIIVGRKGSHGKVTWAPCGGFCIDTALFVDKSSCKGELRYAFYLLESLGLDRTSKDSAVPGLDRFEAHNITIPNHGLPTQKAIADFLDRETARIDQLIEKKQRMVEVLGESLAVLLERLTTPDSQNDTNLIPFRWVCRVTEGQVDPTDPHWAPAPLIAPNHIQSNTGRILAFETAEDQGAISGKYAYSAGTVLYSKIRPALAKACIAPQAGLCSADMYPILTDYRLFPEFLLMQLLSRRFTDWATLESMRVAMPKINRKTLGDHRFWVPCQKIQARLIGQFTTSRMKIEQTTDAVTASIDRLREFRSALITAAVTGQIDVSTWGKQGTTDRRLDQIEEATSA